MAPILKTLQASLALVALTAMAGPAEAQKTGGTLRVYHIDNPPSASVHEEATITTVMAFMPVFNNLVMFGQTHRQDRLDDILPDLAESWSWNMENTKLTLALRQGVAWHDGKSFSAKDVKCTFDSVLDRNDNKLRKNPRKAWYFNLNEVTTEGDHKVTFHLGRPQPSFVAMLATAFSGIYPCHVSMRDMRVKPVGTGPFKVSEFKPNELIHLVRNDKYWKPGLPYLDGIEFTIITSRSTRILGFVAGQFDMTFSQDVTVPLLKDVTSQAPNAICELRPSNSHGNLMVNRDKQPFDDARVRRAMMLAIDRAAFVDILSEGKADIGGAMLPPPEGLWGMPKEMLRSVTGFDPDVAKSRAEGRKIMGELGYNPEKPLKIKVTTRNLPTYRDPAVLLVDHLKHVHIEGELEVLDSSIWYTRMARKDYQVGLNVTGVAIDDPDVNFYENYGCGSERNYTQYCNKDLEALFHKQSAMTDVEERRRLVREIDRQLQEDGARPVFYHSRQATCWQPYVKQMLMNNNSQYNHWRFESVWLDK